MQVDLGGFQFREDLHVFSYQDNGGPCCYTAFTKKHERSGRGYLAVVKMAALKDIARRLQLALIELPEDREVADLYFTPADQVAVCKRPAGRRAR